MWSSDADLLQLMLKRGVSPHRRPFDVPLLNIACRAANEAGVRTLLGAGAKPNQRDDEGRTALIEAVRCEDETIMRLLLNAGANVTNKDDSGRTAAAYAKKRNLTDIAAWLTMDPALVTAPSDKIVETPAARIIDLVEVEVGPRLKARPDFVLMRGNTMSSETYYQGVVHVSSPLLMGGGQVLGEGPSQDVSSSVVSVERTDHEVVWTGIVEIDGTSLSSPRVADHAPLLYP